MNAIGPMLPVHVSKVVEVHQESFPGFFLTFLGPEFLRLFYQGVLLDPCGLALVATQDEGTINGFVVGVMNQAGFYRRLIKNQKFSFAKASLGALMRRPSIAPRLLRALRRPQESADAAADACLMSIAVRQSTEGQGLGRQLADEFCRQAAQRGATAVCLTTDSQNNDRVNHFYQRLGFHVHRAYLTPEGRGMNEYLKILKQ